ncbi:lasso peptide biosynthesis B2 protein [Blastococcus sp. SYSU D00820]
MRGRFRAHRRARRAPGPARAGGGGEGAADRVVRGPGGPVSGLRRRIGLLARRPRRVSSADVRRFVAALRRRRRWSACRSVWDGAWVTATLRRRGLRPLLRGRSELPTAAAEEAGPVVAAVDAGLGLLPVQPTCLRRSVTLLRELDRCGLGATLHIGVRRGPAGVEAHAWVQAGDTVLNDDAAAVADYVQLSVGDAERYLARIV